MAKKKKTWTLVVEYNPLKHKLGERALYLEVASSEEQDPVLFSGYDPLKMHRVEEIVEWFRSLKVKVRAEPPGCDKPDWVPPELKELDDVEAADNGNGSGDQADDVSRTRLPHRAGQRPRRDRR